MGRKTKKMPILTNILSNVLEPKDRGFKGTTSCGLFISGFEFFKVSSIISWGLGAKITILLNFCPKLILLDGTDISKGKLNF